MFSKCIRQVFGIPPTPHVHLYLTTFVQQSLGDKSFKKGQTLNYLNGYQREEPATIVRDLPESTGYGSPGGGDTMGVGNTGSPARTASNYDSPGKLPQWVENDRKVCFLCSEHHPGNIALSTVCCRLQVLRFYGYFKETITESNIENHRIRKVILYYYLEDDSMHIAEPKQDNSGIPQGIFVKRYKLTKDDGGFFTPSDFSVGGETTAYGRTYYLLDADSYTREFYAANFSIELSVPLPYPDDPVDEYRTQFGLTKKTGVRGELGCEDYRQMAACHRRAAWLRPAPANDNW